MVAGYIRSYNKNLDSLDVQRDMIERYCFEHDMEIGRIFCDERKVKTRLKGTAQELLKIGYKESYRGESSFPEFDQLLVLIATGDVDTLIVDVRMRLSVNTHLDDFFDKLCQRYNVEIVEVGEYPPENSPSSVSVAVYHDTNRSKIRPIYCVKDYDELYCTVHLKGWTVVLSLLDECRCKGGRKKFPIIMKNLNKCNVIMVRAMFIIDLKTGKFIQYLSVFYQNGIGLYTLSSGEVTLNDNECILNKKNRIVAYDSFSSNQQTADFLKKIMTSFVKHKTNWVLCDYYYEGHRIHKDEEQKVLEEVMNSQDDWDGILVKSFSRINERTTKFEKLLLRLNENKFIYSMEEGVYLYGKKEKSFVL